MVRDQGLRLAIGDILRQYRESRNISQAAFAAELGISQPYLSRLEREQRSAVSLSLWTKITAVVDRPELYIIDDHADDLDELYDRALISYGSGDHTTAEALFESVSRSDDTTSTAAADLVAKATFWLAGIRRDRNELHGESGAESLYRRVLASYRTRYSQRRILEVRFVMAACREMDKDYKHALQMYQSLLAELPDTADQKLDRMRTRVNGRIGALTTKVNDLERAARHLVVATALSVHLEDSGPYSYYHEKMAILQTRQGQLDEAYGSMVSARREITEADHLRRVQSYCVEANILQAEGDTEGAITVLRNAKRLAQQKLYGHQLEYIDSLLITLESDA
jgi:transcriptional regulator with XRE-family HTH domain